MNIEVRRPIVRPCVAALLLPVATASACFSPSSAPTSGETDDATTGGRSTASTGDTPASATADPSTSSASTTDSAGTQTATTEPETTTGDDTTPPSIVEITPGDGDEGVRSDVVLVVTFDEPMDRVATQAGYQSRDIAAGSVVFSWSADDTILTIDPNDDLAYAEGSDRAVVEALAYAFSMTATATDLAGNPLSNPAVVTFTTLRRITPRLPAVDAMTGDVALNGTSLGIEVCIGDQYYMAGTDGWVNGGITFDISSLPAGIEEFQSATLEGDQVALNGTPYSVLGDLRAEHVVFPTLVELWDAVLLEDVGVFSNSPTFGDRSIDVLAQIEADYAGADGLSQYRLAFEQLSDGDGAPDYACFSKAPDALFLALDYLVP